MLVILYISFFFIVNYFVIDSIWVLNFIDLKVDYEREHNCILRLFDVVSNKELQVSREIVEVGGNDSITGGIINEEESY